MIAALLGFGNIGSTLYELIEKRGFGKKHGIEIKRVFCRKWRDEISDKTAREYGEILGDDSIDTVIELIGGEEPAYGYIRDALLKKKNVITANKVVMSRHLGELMHLAHENGVKLYFSASVGGGIPWLNNLIRAAQINNITDVRGIMNGTSNFILDGMLKHSAEFNVALRKAQQLGLAENDPSQDIDGGDAAAKLAISASVAFGALVEVSDIAVCGIRNITRDDVDLFFEKGLSCKLISTAEKRGERICAYVEPLLVEEGTTEQSIKENGNHLTFEGDCCGIQSFFGEGAGKYPTAQNVLRDVLDLCDGEYVFGHIAQDAKDMPRAIIDNSFVSHRYYVRTCADDVAEKLLGCECERMDHRTQRTYVTDVMPVYEMHSIAEKIKRRDPDMFFAAIK